MNWKSLHLNAPCEDCNVCVKVGDNYETYFYKRYTQEAWELIKFHKVIPKESIPVDAQYINLDDIL